MTLRGVIIPGLAMSAAEVNAGPDVCVLDNPEVGDGITLDRDYDLDEVAEIHAGALAAIDLADRPTTLCGISMGAMVLAIIATRHRHRLPRRSRFVFFVTTPNLPSNPAITPSLVDSWRQARPGDVRSFSQTLSSMFGATFLAHEPAKADAYFEFRATGGNRQSGRAFFRQVDAIRRAELGGAFAALDGSECEFIGGADDRLLGPSHSRDLQHLCPTATHREVHGMGHMIHYERPDLLYRIFERPH